MDAAPCGLSGELVGISAIIQCDGLEFGRKVHDEHKIALTIGAHLRGDSIGQVAHQRPAEAEAARQLAVKIAYPGFVSSESDVVRLPDAKLVDGDGRHPGVKITLVG